MNNNPNCKCIWIENVSCIKYLGIYYIDFNLKWKKHIEYLVSLSCTFFYIFRNLRWIFYKIQLKIIYISLVQSNISYGIESWGCAHDIHLKKTKNN